MVSYLNHRKKLGFNDWNMVQNSIIEIKTSTGSRMISTRDIVYVKAAGKFSVVHIRNTDTLIAYHILKWFCNSLPVTCFYRTHNSYLVSFSFVESYCSKKIKLTNKIDLPISKKRFKAFKKNLRRFLESQ